MNGKSTRTKYDNCNFVSYCNTTRQPANYALYSGKYENEQNRKKYLCANQFTCERDKYGFTTDCKLNCHKCDSNAEAEISNMWGSIGLRVDIENELRQGRYFSKCPQQQYVSCKNNRAEEDRGTKKISPYEEIYGPNLCNLRPVVVPALCERTIVLPNTKPISCPLYGN